MGLQRLSDPGAEPVTLAEAKAHCRVDVTDDDSLITALITAARMDCENRLGRTLIQSTWKVTLDAFPDAIALPRPPVISVASVQYVDAAGVLQTLAGSAYSLDNASDDGRHWLVPAYGYTWPTTRAQANAVAVTYSAGYGVAAANVPRPIRQWILAQIAMLYEARETESERPTSPVGAIERLVDVYRIFEV